MMLGECKHGQGRTRLPLPFSAETWDRSKGLRQGITVAFVICSLAAAGNWYNWFHGIGSLSFPVGFTIGAGAALILTPRKWELLALSAGGLLGLEILQFALHGTPVHLAVEWIFPTAIAAVVFQYMRMKVKNSRRDAEPRQQRNRRREDTDWR